MAFICKDPPASVTSSLDSSLGHKFLNGTKKKKKISKMKRKKIQQSKANLEATQLLTVYFSKWLPQ